MALPGRGATNYREDMERLSRLKFEAHAYESSTLAGYDKTNNANENITGANQLIITYDDHAHRSMLADFSYELIRRWMLQAGVNSLVITSVFRGASDQARVMYHNLKEGRDISYQPPGRRVVDVYWANKGKGPDEIRSLMEKKINKEGLPNVTPHGEDKNWVNTIDIAPSSISPSSRKDAFRHAIEKQVGDAVRKFLHPGNSKDPAFHVEIKQGVYRALWELKDI